MRYFVSTKNAVKVAGPGIQIELLIMGLIEIK